MSTDFNTSFIKIHERPKNCPNCDYEFDIEDLKYSEDEDGSKEILYCDKCDYQIVLQYTKVGDTEDEVIERHKEMYEEIYEEKINETKEEYRRIDEKYYER